MLLHFDFIYNHSGNTFLQRRHLRDYLFSGISQTVVDRHTNAEQLGGVNVAARLRHAGDVRKQERGSQENVFYVPCNCKSFKVLFSLRKLLPLKPEEDQFEC